MPKAELKAAVRIQAFRPFCGDSQVVPAGLRLGIVLLVDIDRVVERETDLLSQPLVVFELDACVVARAGPAIGRLPRGDNFRNGDFVGNAGIVQRQRHGIDAAAADGVRPGLGVR